MGGMLSLRPIMGDDGHGSIVAIERCAAPRTPCAAWWSSLPKAREAAASSLTMVLSYCNCPSAP
ncbi:MAG: hypothetical protein ACLRI7_02200 [Ruthenibacterium lactatiformans]